MAAQVGFAPTPARLTNGWTTVIRLSTQKWSARQELHLRSPGPRPGMLMLHHARLPPTIRVRSRGWLITDFALLGVRFRGKDCQNGASDGNCTHILPADNGLLCVKLLRLNKLVENGG